MPASRLFVLLSFAALGCGPASQEPTGGSTSHLDESCLLNEDCDEGLYCATAEGQCGGEGTCQAFPAVCPHFVRTTCGCDGQDYDNFCAAALKGASLDHEGSCQTKAPAMDGTCVTKDDCPQTQYCAYADGECGGTGTCQPRGINLFCVGTNEWVCGCDGVTYGNTCLEHKAGVSLASQGGCACQVDADCTGDLPGGCSAWSCVDGACQGACE